MKRYEKVFKRGGIEYRIVGNPIIHQFDPDEFEVKIYEKNDSFWRPWKLIFSITQPQNKMKLNELIEYAKEEAFSV